MAFVDQGEFEAMKTVSGCRAPRCDKHQFCAKTSVDARHLGVSPSERYNTTWMPYG